MKKTRSNKKATKSRPAAPAPVEAPPPEPERPFPGWLHGLTVVAALFIALFEILADALRIITHSDLWWAMSAGRHITSTWEVPTRDIFSYTFLDKPWINMEWLAQVVFYNVYEGFGENAIVVFRATMILLVFSLMFFVAWDRTKNAVLSLLCVGAAAYVCQPFLDCRPQIFTFFNASLYIVILHLYRRRGRNLLFLLPVLMLFWVNLHYGYIFGLLLLIGNLGAESLKLGLAWLSKENRLPIPWAPSLSGRQIAWLAGAFGVTFLVVFLNPWGTYGLIHPIEMSKFVAGDTPFLTILEWQKPPFWGSAKFSPFWFWPLSFTLLGLALWTLIFRFKLFDINDVGLSVVLFLFFAVPHRRFIPLFTVLSIPLLVFSLNEFLRWIVGLAASPARLARAGRVVTGVAVIVGCLALGTIRVNGWTKTYVTDNKDDLSLFAMNTQAQFYPEVAIDFIREWGLEGPMYNLYNWGGYLMYHFPEQKVFTDGRAQTVYTEDFYLTNLKVHHARDGWRDVLNQYGCRYALVSMGETNANLRRTLYSAPDWRWVLADGFAALYLKVCPENREILARYKNRELPLPENGLTYYIYGRHEIQAGNNEQAVEDFRKAAELSPEREEFLQSVIMSLLRSDRITEAAEEVARARERFPDSTAIAIEAVRIDAIRGRGQQAFEGARKLFLAHPEKLEIVDILLTCDTDAGIDLVRNSQERNPLHPGFNLAAGRVMEVAKRWEEAERFYLQAMKSAQLTDRKLANTAARKVTEVRQMAAATQRGRRP